MDPETTRQILAAIDKEFQKLDTDKNGTIDFKEFQKFVKKNLLAIVNKV